MRKSALNSPDTTMAFPCAVVAEATLGAPRKGSLGIIVALVLWLTVVCGATVLMTRYSNTPGGNGPAPASWPKDSGLSLDSSRPTLLMFIHPHCPCTRASLGELDRLLAQISKQPVVEVVCVKPAGLSSDWSRTDLTRQAASIRGVKVYLDDCGLEARRFAAQTSGQTLLYGPNGDLKFQGGITVARGHEGDNPGRTALRELLQEGHSRQVKTEVFGCGLFDTQCRKADVICKP
jgi:hypothetical protein